MLEGRLWLADSSLPAVSSRGEEKVRALTYRGPHHDSVKPQSLGIRLQEVSFGGHAHSSTAFLALRTMTSSGWIHCDVEGGTRRSPWRR